MVLDGVRRILVVCVDRDDDLGRKTKIVGPIIGKKKNIQAASKLALKDPADSDVNCIFAAVKKFEEVSENYTAEIVTLTGHGKFGFEGDKRINEQLDIVLEKFHPDGFILVTDGAEDDQVIPILQSRAKIISKENVIVKQAKEVESTFYTIKEALKDPYLARLAFGIPGIILLLMFALPTIGLQVIMFIAGAYLLLKGFGIEEKIISTFQEIIKSISMQKMSFPFYIATLFILAFGVISGYTAWQQALTEELALQAVEGIMPVLFFAIIASVIFNLGRSVDAVHLKKAYYLKNYFRNIVSAVLIWFILDSGRLVFIGKTDLMLFLLTIVASFAVFYIAFKASNVLDVRSRITKLLIGLPVYAADGTWLGKVEDIDKRKRFIEFKESKTKKKKKIEKQQFVLREGRVFLTA